MRVENRELKGWFKSQSREMHEDRPVGGPEGNMTRFLPSHVMSGDSNAMRTSVFHVDARSFWEARSAPHRSARSIELIACINVVRVELSSIHDNRLINSLYQIAKNETHIELDTTMMICVIYVDSRMPGAV
jgi:hypothetical protein